jgi:dGTPase
MRRRLGKAATARSRLSKLRDARRHESSNAGTRTASERDRDLVLYTVALRRLAGVTQVVAADLSHPVHNRLTHVLEVAQIGRRLAQKLLREKKGEARAWAVGGIDPEIVEAACLAHDLGHPPFGHIAEHELNELANQKQLADGFEGNAQSFRVVTKLAFRRAEHPGLDLSRAALNAILKYPWLRETGPGKYSEKWGAYHTERADFEWARETALSGKVKSAEAELMDFADDIAYSVHDAEDFYQAGRIPLDRLIKDDEEKERFFENAFARWGEQREVSRKACQQALDHLLSLYSLGITEPFGGKREQTSRLRQVSSTLIDRFIRGITLTPGAQRTVAIDPQVETEIRVLKEMTWVYVINNPSLASQQHGQRRVIRELFEIFIDAVEGKNPHHLLPLACREHLETIRGTETEAQEKVRVVLDLIAGMTELQAIEMYRRLAGISDISALYDIML